MTVDSIVAEVRRAREELASQFNYDLHAMIQNARERQKRGGRKVVSFPPVRLPQTNAKEVFRAAPTSTTSSTVEVTS
jgi:hypothetical protein